MSRVQAAVAVDTAQVFDRHLHRTFLIPWQAGQNGFACSRALHKGGERAHTTPIISLLHMCVCKGGQRTGCWTTYVGLVRLAGYVGGPAVIVSQKCQSALALPWIQYQHASQATPR